MQPLNLVINLVVPEEVILGRIMGKFAYTKRIFFFRKPSFYISYSFFPLSHLDRWVHIPSGRVYNLSYNPPKIAGHDDVTGEPLSKRQDDNPDTFKVRIQKYQTLTAPLLDHYKDVMVTLKGNTSDEIYPQIERELVNRFGMLPHRLEIKAASVPKSRANFRKTTRAPQVVDNEQSCMAAGI